MVSSVKKSEKGETSIRRAGLEKCKDTTGTVNFQSTLLEDHDIARPDLDVSAINDKSLFKKTPGSKSVLRGESTSHKKEQKSKSFDSEDVIGMMESQALLLTYASIKMEKNIAKLEKEAEINLAILCAEKEKQQQELYGLKRQRLLQKREQQLEGVLDKQVEVLGPLVTTCEQFKNKYKTFATALDITRHELPVKNIHIEGNRHRYLEDLKKELAITQRLLEESEPGFSKENAKAFPVLKELKEVALKMDAELERSFKQVQDLSFEVSKEVSLNNQKVCEEIHGKEILKHWYF
uniref:HAUS augmin like complex subunit 8 n=1 Tax=Pelodiscus sinensis TaxID=13735 RepID=K7F270_PELSI|nr:HAUS augmin-like complex subunit 8 [Pelodiscus sinensis]|eukprot:XP_006126871.1 HAUS augmin-like complex subunit 8 [Pelodiscus sinensis]